jgi:hypothetical protein
MKSSLINTSKLALTAQQRSGNSSNPDDMKYKAAKYHYKIQEKLKKDYVSQHKTVPTGYEEYLQPFRE